MAIPQFWRLAVVNNSGQTLTFNSNGRVNMKVTAIEFNTTDGDLIYTPLADNDCDFDAGRSVADGTGIMDDSSLLMTAEIDNTANEYVGLQVQLEITHDEGAAADGTFDVYLLGGDASGELQSDASGFLDFDDGNPRSIGSLVWNASGGDDEVMRSDVFSVGV